MTDADLQYDYMLTHIRLHSASDPIAWTPRSVVMAFNILPPPAVRFDDWKAALPGDIGLTDEDQQKANDQARMLVELEKHIDKDSPVQ